LRVTNFEALAPADVAASEEIHPTQCLVDSDGSKASPIAEIAPAGSAFMENVLANDLLETIKTNSHSHSFHQQIKLSLFPGTTSKFETKAKQV